MKKKIIFILIMLVAFSVTVETICSQSKRDFKYDFDLRNGGEENIIGIDYKLDYELSEKVIAGHNFNWIIGAKGYRDFNSEVASGDYLNFSVKFQGYYFISGMNEDLDLRLKREWLEIGKTPPDLQSKKELARMSEITTQILGVGSRYISYDLHYLYENNQDFTIPQHVFGAGVSFEIPYLHELIDFVPSISREPFIEFSPHPIRAYAGFNYVTDSKVAENDPATDSKNYGRLDIELAWRTLVLDNQILRIKWQAHYLVDEPNTFDVNGKDFNSFVEVELLSLLNNNLGVILKYLEGRIGPAYEQTSGGFVGLSYLLK